LNGSFNGKRLARGSRRALRIFFLVVIPDVCKTHAAAFEKWYGRCLQQRGSKNLLSLQKGLC
jgi:hypothetical protein